MSLRDPLPSSDRGDGNDRSHSGTAIRSRRTLNSLALLRIHRVIEGVAEDSLANGCIVDGTPNRLTAVELVSPDWRKSR